MISYWGSNFRVQRARAWNTSTVNVSHSVGHATPSKCLSVRWLHKGNNWTTSEAAGKQQVGQNTFQIIDAFCFACRLHVRILITAQHVTITLTSSKRWIENFENWKLGGKTHLYIQYIVLPFVSPQDLCKKWGDQYPLSVEPGRSQIHGVGGGNVLHLAEMTQDPRSDHRISSQISWLRLKHDPKSCRVTDPVKKNCFELHRTHFSWPEQNHLRCKKWADHQVVFDGEGRPKERKLLLSLLLATGGIVFQREVSNTVNIREIRQITHMKSANIIDINRMKSLINSTSSLKFTASAWHINQPGLVVVGNSPCSSSWLMEAARFSNISARSSTWHQLTSSFRVKWVKHQQNQSITKCGSCCSSQSTKKYQSFWHFLVNFVNDHHPPSNSMPGSWESNGSTPQRCGKAHGMAKQTTDVKKTSANH